MNEENGKNFLYIIGHMMNTTDKNFAEIEKAFKAQRKFNKRTLYIFAMMGTTGMLTTLMSQDIYSRLNKLEKILAEQNQGKGENEM